jgi:uncharacterized OB-fold protein
MNANVTPDSEPDVFQSGLEHHELRVQRCSACGYVRHPARWLCPECLSEDYSWDRLSGDGHVETFTWYLRHVPPVPKEIQRQPPYNVAVVALVEGPRVLSNVEDVAFGELQVGDRVTARFDDAPTGVALKFVEVTGETNARGTDHGPA